MYLISRKFSTCAISVHIYLYIIYAYKIDRINDFDIFSKNNK